MIEFEWPTIFYLAPLPLLVRYLLPAIKHIHNAALRVPNIDEFKTIHSVLQAHKKAPISLLLAFIAWLLLVTAAARPLYVGDIIELPVSGRDLIMAVDLSESMSMEDFMIGNNAVDRLTATKKVAGEFIQRRISDRIGLILFGEQAYVQTPLTFDRETVHTLLMESAIGLAGGKTAIGDAIGLAIKRFQKTKTGNDKEEHERVLILLTDGENTAGEVTPLQAAELAATMGLKIYTIGIGADEMMIRDFFITRRINPSQGLDEKTLRAIADKTGGRYFRARDTDELNKIYAILDELEPIEQETESFRPTKALYYWPLSIAFLLAAIIILARIIRGAA